MPYGKDNIKENNTAELVLNLPIELEEWRMTTLAIARFKNLHRGWHSLFK